VNCCPHSASSAMTALSTYDANGNTLTDPSGKSYTWDFENRLTQAVVPGTNGGTTTFKYDPFGRRIQKSGPLGTTNYLYDGHNDIEEVDSSGNVLARYTQGPRIDQPLAELRSGTTSFYQQDALRSVTSLSNAAGALANTYTFDSFGKLTASTGALTNLFQYTARESDPETGLYYYRERYYDLSAGRFVSEDPVRFGSGDVDFYAYVRNHPQNVGDPFGLCPPDKPHCFAQLKYRSSYEFFSHAFWWVQDSNGTNWVIDGGPSLPHGHGYLNSWVNLGDSGHYETDNSDDATAFDSGTSDVVCDAVDKMILAAENWQNNTTPYSSTGPNSNTFAHDIGNAGGFNPPAPPRTIGW
jgi:RHS repeat-associated protein